MTRRNWLKASKVIGFSSELRCVAANALGPPNEFKWASDDSSGREVEYIELEFPKAIYITEINILGLRPYKSETDYFVKVCVRCNTGPYTTVMDKNVQGDSEKQTVKVTVSKAAAVYGNRVRIEQYRFRSHQPKRYLDAVEIAGFESKPQPDPDDVRPISPKGSPPPTDDKSQVYLSTSTDLMNGKNQKFTEADENIDNSSNQPSTDEYQSVIVKEGTWILYEHSSFNTYAPDSQMMKVGPGTHSLQVGGRRFIPKSIRPIDDAPNTLILFEHKNYGGKMLAYTSDQSYLKDFPAFNERGVSSMIIQPSESWEIYTGADYYGNTRIKAPGDYPDCTTFYDTDNVIQSVRKSQI